MAADAGFVEMRLGKVVGVAIAEDHPSFCVVLDAVSDERRLAITNLSNPSPPRWIVWALFDHPPVMDRIAVARGYSSASSSSAP